MNPRSRDIQKSDDLSPAWRRELLRRVREANDPRRYLLASVFTARFVLYYNVEHHAYVLGKPEEATAFKSRRAAVAVLKTLGKNVALITAKRRKDGTLQVSRKSLRDAATLAAGRKSSKVRD
jgi:hypothetical protein